MLCSCSFSKKIFLLLKAKYIYRKLLALQYLLATQKQKQLY
ncbi:hypothetical protein D593_0832 [Streptococcus intermedius BA1]|nr:hypothetical protein D593_0832 [Streptococcus intermedius BA1]